MHEHKHAEGKRRPEPPDLDKIHIKHVLLEREVAGRELRRVALRIGAVRRSARRGRERADDAAHKQGRGVDGDEEGFEAGGEEGRSARAGGERLHSAAGFNGAGGHTSGYGGGVVRGDSRVGVFAAGGHCWGLRGVKSWRCSEKKVWRREIEVLDD